MKIRILRPALEDLAVGREFYDRQREGVGGYFFSIVCFPRSIRWCSMPGSIVCNSVTIVCSQSVSLYAVYYRVAENEAVVHRVLDCRRDPRWIRRALQEKG